MDDLDRIMDEQAARNDAIFAARESLNQKTAAKPETTCVDEFAFVGLYRSEVGWCRLLANYEKRQIKLEKLNDNQVQKTLPEG